MISNDTHAMMTYEANKKSAGIAFLLWLLLGALGAHRLYAGYYAVGMIQVVLGFICCVLFAAIPLSVVLTFPYFILVLLDGFAIPSMIRKHNSAIVAQLSA